MPIERFEDSKTPITVKEINDYEAKLNCKFPKAYQDFLLSHNGGFPEPSGYIPVGQQGPTEAVDYFLSIGGDEQEDILSVYESNKELLNLANIDSTKFIPIAVDSFSNLIMLAVDPKNAGGVYFLSNEKEDFTKNEDVYKRDKYCSCCKFIYLINPDFNNWLETFTDDEEFEFGDDDFKVQLDENGNLDEEGQKQLKKKTLELLIGRSITDKELETYLETGEIDFDDDDDDKVCRTIQGSNLFEDSEDNSKESDLTDELGSDLDEEEEDDSGDLDYEDEEWVPAFMKRVIMYILF